jgi:fatty-acid desaturase
MNMLKSLHFWRVWLPPHIFAIIGWSQLGWDWRILAVFLVCYTFISGLGVAVGLHRFFSHKAFKTTNFWEQAMLYSGMLACHGNPLFWVALHRGLHHRYSDTEKDPHSPVAHSLWHSYQGYAFDPTLPKQVPIRAGADFLRRSDWQWSVSNYHSVLWATWGLVFLISLLFGTWWLFVGFVTAQVWAIHQEALVNVVGHKSWLGAYRNWPDHKDQSVNRPILGLFTWGQALHNNHHARAADANFGGDRWYEFDPSMLWIKVIQHKK